MISVGWALFLAFVFFLFCIIFIVLFNKNSTTDVEFGYGPRRLLKLKEGGGFALHSCEPDLNGGWFYPNSNNKDINYVNVKKGMLGGTYPVDFDATDKIILDDQQGKIMIAGVSFLTQKKNHELDQLKERNAYLENLLSQMSVQVNDLTFKQDELEKKSDLKAKRKAEIIPFIKFNKGGK